MGHIVLNFGRPRLRWKKIAMRYIVLNLGRPRLGQKIVMMYIVLNFRRPRPGGGKSGNGLFKCGI